MEVAEERPGMRQSILRTLLSAFGVAVLLVVFLKPTVQLSTGWQIVTLAVMEAVAIGLSRYLAGNGHGASWIKALLFAFMLALVVTYVYAPSAPIGFEATLLVVSVLEFGALISARVISGKN